MRLIRKKTNSSPAFTSMRFIAALGRAASPDTSVYLSHWVDRCQDWASLVDISPIGSVGRAFFSAAVASGVCYQLGNNATGDLPAVGLKLHGGTPATSDGWKRTLGGDVLLPTQPARRFA
jgi:hypothetical protein